MIAGDPLSLSDPACGAAAPLGGAASVEVSPDGRHVYVVATRSRAIVVFTRYQASGALGFASCVSQDVGLAGAPAPAAAGCLAAAGLNDPTAIALSPDGANAYVTSAEAGTVASFRRDGTTGALVPVAGGCLADTAALVGPAAGCNAATGLVGAVDVVVTADGMHVHVAASQADAVASFLRDPVNGALTQLPAPHSCLSAAGLAGCAQASRLSGASALALTPGGRHLVVTARSGAVLSLERQLAPICAPTFVAGIVGPTPVPLPCADPNGDPLTFQVLSSPQRGTVIVVDHASGAATYAPGVGAAGHDTFSFAARDDGGAAGAPALASLELATQATAALRVKAAKDVRAPQLRSSKLVFASHRRLRVKLRCPTHEAFGCRGTISIKTARRIPVRILRNARLAAGPRAIARRVVFVRKLRFSLKGASTRTVSTSLKKKHLRLLKRIGRTRVDVTLVARDVAGNVAKSKRRVVLQPPKPS